jgi:N-acetylglucosaminyldiphosphoundecaprenol N-acetyl-beta-D-mannosaminyltransferase
MNELLAKTWPMPLNMIGFNGQKLLINTINSHSYNVAQNDQEFYNALMKSDILIPDGIGVVHALRFLDGTKIKKIAAYDLMTYELEYLNQIGGKCFFLGSSENVLELVVQRASKDYPKTKIGTYSPPFKKTFSEEDNTKMVDAVNSFSPQVLFVGMTAPKQEKWTALHFERLNANHIGCIGATFDFYAGTITRAPKWMIDQGFEWLYRLVREPKRMWRRYVLGIPIFAYYMLREKFKVMKSHK